MYFAGALSVREVPRRGWDNRQGVRYVPWQVRSYGTWVRTSLPSPASLGISARRGMADRALARSTPSRKWVAVNQCAPTIQRA